jgi:hypothetical protein
LEADGKEKERMGWLCSTMGMELVPAILHIHIEDIADAPESNRAALPQSCIHRHSLLFK